MTTILLERHDFRPFESVAGRVTWELDKPPRDLELRLCWFTRGRGTEESRTVECLALGNSAHGARDFSFVLPGEPWSVDGTLIRIAWALEVVAKKSGALALEEIVVAPDLRVIGLTEAANARTTPRVEKWARKFPRFKR